MENILLGFANVFQPMNLLICLGGLFIGVLFGALPGFSATMAVAIFVPFTYVMEPGAALLLLSALYCGGVFGGSIPAVLVGIPGTPASAPTAWEGKALVQKGEAGRALSLVTVASCFGGFISSVALLICAPLLAKIAKMVGQPEQMFVAIFGLSVVVMLSQDNLFKGCLVAIVTLLIATFGQDPVEGFPRFTYGFSQLTAGFSVVPVLIGLFSLPEVFKMLEDPFGKMAESGKVGSMKPTSLRTCSMPSAPPSWAWSSASSPPPAPISPPSWPTTRPARPLRLPKRSATAAPRASWPLRPPTTA